MDQFGIKINQTLDMLGQNGLSSTMDVSMSKFGLKLPPIIAYNLLIVVGVWT